MEVDDPRPALREVTAPVLVLQGACDFIPYAAAYEYVDLMPNARYVFVEGAGHVIWWDRPIEYLEEIARFLSGTDETDGPVRRPPGTTARQEHAPAGAARRR